MQKALEELIRARNILICESVKCADVDVVKDSAPILSILFMPSQNIVHSALLNEIYATISNAVQDLLSDWLNAICNFNSMKSMCGELLEATSMSYRSKVMRINRELKLIKIAQAMYFCWIQADNETGNIIPAIKGNFTVGRSYYNAYCDTAPGDVTIYLQYVQYMIRAVIKMRDSGYRKYYPDFAPYLDEHYARIKSSR